MNNDLFLRQCENHLDDTSAAIYEFRAFIYCRVRSFPIKYVAVRINGNCHVVKKLSFIVKNLASVQICVEKLVNSV